MSASYVLVAALLAFTTGLIQVAMSMLNAGALTQLISLPVISGFVSGSAFLSIANQSATLLGITKCGKPNAAGLNGYACTFTQVRRYIITIILLYLYSGSGYEAYDPDRLYIRVHVLLTRLCRP